MKIDRLEIQNFRGIRSAIFEDLGDTIVIAGPNGSGKSCVFDAIKFLKSIYGGYQQNEVQQFLSEFQINPAHLDKDIIKLFNDKSKSLKISALFSLSDEEKDYIGKNARELLSEVIWRSLIPDAFNYGFYTTVQYSAQFRERQPEVDARLKDEIPLLQKDLASGNAIAELIAHPSGQVQFVNNKLLSVVFNSFRPPHIGVIDYHGPARLYTRESIQSITLSFDQSQQDQKRNSAIYGYSSKYTNVKAEMAAAYVKDVLAERANPGSSGSNLTATLKELFEHFFPDKEFLGPQPTPEGNLEFPVRVGSSTHDLDELSSGEKEVLYGYLRMRNSAPRHSLILLDEPELHLNPALIKGLPQFYRRHLSLALKNQMWLVSHSDALLREVVGRDGYNVFHMVPSTASESEPQLRRLKEDEELQIALVDLVGDVAAYKPGAKALILEGGGDSDFDQSMVATLFPEVAANVNLISGSNKVRVEALLEVLERSSKKGDLPIKFFAITDRDLGASKLAERFDTHFAWDAYHIENYLLDGHFIADVWRSLGAKQIPTSDQVLDDLRLAARDVKTKIVRQRMMSAANAALVGAISVGFDPAAEDLGLALAQAVSNSVDRINSIAARELEAKQVSEMFVQIDAEVEASFASGAWRKDLPGRDILKRYLSSKSSPVGYEVFRNLILTKMSDADFKPDGMRNVLEEMMKR